MVPIVNTWSPAPRVRLRPPSLGQVKSRRVENVLIGAGVGASAGIFLGTVYGVIAEQFFEYTEVQNPIFIGILVGAIAGAIWVGAQS